jgi:hypothetical protein
MVLEIYFIIVFFGGFFLVFLVVFTGDCLVLIGLQCARSCRAMRVLRKGGRGADVVG